MSREVAGLVIMFKNPFILFGLAVVILLLFLPSYQIMQDLKQKNQEYEKEMHALVRENMRLSEEKHLLETEPAYLEKVARERMGLIREGEIIYRIVGPDEASSYPLKGHPEGYPQMSED